MYRYSIFGDYSGNQNLKNTENDNEDYIKITPQTLKNMIGKEKIAIVNTLSNKITINKLPLESKNLFGKNFIDRPDINNFDLVVLYCANGGCNASHNYADKLKKLINKDKIILYESGLHEWAMYSIIYPKEFAVSSFNLVKFDNSELYEIISSNSYRNETQKKNIDYNSLILQNSNTSNVFSNFERIKINQVNFNNNLLENKVCVVTGGTSGLGLACVYTMLNNGAKHVTLTFYHNIERAKKVETELSKKYNKSRFLVLRADARTKNGNELTFNKKLRKEKLKLDFPGINCVNINAGIFGPANLHKKHVHNISDDDFNKVMDTNLFAYYLGIKHFAQQAIENNIKDGSIVCIKSIYGSTGSLFSNIAYQTSKHGVMGLVRQSAVELARENKKLGIKYPIRINAVSPTFTDTALTKPLLENSLVGNTIKNSNPSGNLANKFDIANAIVYLLSDISKSITGIDLPVDCGVLAESIPMYKDVKEMNDKNIEILSCCGDTI